MYRYAFQGFEKEKMARAVSLDLPISMKNATMVCNAVRGKHINRAKKILGEAIEKKIAIKFTRFNKDRGHKTGMGPGKYPVKTCTKILGVIKSAEANAHQKNLGSELVIRHICVHTASRPYRFGRARRRKMKRSHLEVVLEEVKQEPEQKEGKK